jgi:hypothetical protein
MRYQFDGYEEARDYLQEQLHILNEASDIETEKLYLKVKKPALQLSEVRTCKVNTYSLATIDNNYYSVPEYLVGETVTARIYFETIRIYAQEKLVCEHKKVDGFKAFQIDIMHYLNTFLKKPGALRNSHALKASPELKHIYDSYYRTKPREFIEILQANCDVRVADLTLLLRDVNQSHIDKQITHQYPETRLEKITRNQIYSYTKLIN